MFIHFNVAGHSSELHTLLTLTLTCAFDPVLFILYTSRPPHSPDSFLHLLLIIPLCLRCTTRILLPSLLPTWPKIRIKFLLHLRGRPLAYLAIMNTLTTVLCQWEDEITRERTILALWVKYRSDVYLLLATHCDLHIDANIDSLVDMGQGVVCLLFNHLTEHLLFITSINPWV